LELMIVPLTLLAVGLIIATPALTLYLLFKQRKLDQRFRALSELHKETNDALHRELLELKRQTTGQSREAAAPAPPPIETSQPSPVASRAIEKPTPVRSEPSSVAPVPVTKPAEASSTLLENKSETVPQQKPPMLCPWCGTIHSGGTKNCPPPVPVVPRVPVPEVLARQVQRAVVDESNAGKKSNVGAAETTVVRAKPPQDTVPASASGVAPPPQESARTAAPPQFAAFRAPITKGDARQRLKSVFALEETLGTNWLNKLGIIILVLGVALFGIYELGQLGPLGKVGLSYVVSLMLLCGGIFLEKRERYRVLGHTLIGGGWALLFFTSYALNHVQAMRVMSSETADLILMLAVALAMVLHTLRYRSQLVTGLAFLLAYSTVALSHDNVYSLSAGAVLAVGLVIIVLKMGWFELEVFGILSSYLNHLYWLYRLLGPTGAHGHAFPEYHASTALLLFYWITYRISYLVRTIKSSSDEKLSTAAALLNTLLLLSAMKFQSVQPELAFFALLIIGAIEFSLGQLPTTKRRRQAFIVLTVLGAALMLAAVPFRYSGNNVAILWLVGAEALLMAGAMAGEVVFRRLGLFAGLLVAGHLAAIDFMRLVAIRHTNEDLVLSLGVTFALCGVIFYVNALFIARRWRMFGNWPDTQLISIHSYLGGFAASAAAWALCSRDWTALGLAGVMLVLAGCGQRSRSSQLEPRHLQWQYGLVGALAIYRITIVNLHAGLPQPAHLFTRLITLPILAAMFYATAKWAALSDDGNQQTFRGLFAFAGTALVTSLIYYEVPELWQPVAAILFAVMLLEAGQRIRYNAFHWHVHVVSTVAVVFALTADPSGAQRWHGIPLHAFAVLPVVVGLYWIAKSISAASTERVAWARAAYSWAATGLMAWALYEAAAAPWLAVAWIIFAVILALVRRRISYAHLAWQANAIAACALVRTYEFNYLLQQKLWQGFSLRLVTVAIVAAGLYFLSRRAVVRDSESARAITHLHTLGATALLALLAWYEAPNGWVVAVWALFALVLASLDRRFDCEELAWQAHALAALTMVRSVTVNLQVLDKWHGISVRLLSLAIVIVVFYALSRVIRMPDEWRVREFHHVYSWAASGLVSLLMWYELQPLTVAVGWAVFGLVLFEYGWMRKLRQFRFQSYVALSAAFGRIFFANLTTGTPGEFWGPRIYTILPITLILFYVYFQLGRGEDAGDDFRWHFDALLAYLGTGTVIALFYFQFANDWIVTAWAAVVFVLFAIALAVDRPIFLYQGLILTVGVCTRGMVHNLFGASYFSDGNWTGRYFVLGSAIAVLLACSRPAADLFPKVAKGDCSASGAVHVLCPGPAAYAYACGEDAGGNGYRLLGTRGRGDRAGCACGE
jgi:Predicted membrane protein (DUF2339)